MTSQTSCVGGWSTDLRGFHGSLGFSRPRMIENEISDDLRLRRIIPHPLATSRIFTRLASNEILSHCRGLFLRTRKSNAQLSLVGTLPLYEQSGVTYPTVCDRTCGSCGSPGHFAKSHSDLDMILSKVVQGDESCSPEEDKLRSSRPGLRPHISPSSFC